MARVTPPGLLALASLVLWSVPAHAGSRLGGGGGLDLSLTRIVISLLLCLALAAAITLLLKRNGGRVSIAGLRVILSKSVSSEQRIRVIESRRISVHADLCLVRCDDIDYVILSSGQQQQLLRQTPVTETPGE